MSDWAAKRFWKEATVVAVEGGFTVMLDGRGVKTPAKTPLVVPTKALADAIAAEWDAQGEKVDPLTMPVTRGANAALDKVAIQKAEVAEMLAAYGDSDLLCYRAAGPKELVALQRAAWDPLLEWSSSDLGAPLDSHEGVMHVPQNQASLDALTRHVTELDNFALAAFHDLVAMSGSLVLALAVIRRRLSAADAWRMSRVDEDWQISQWGEDDEAQATAAIKHSAFLAAARFYEMTLT